MNNQSALVPIAPFVFFTTLLVYTGQRYYKIYFTTLVVETPRIEWMKKNKKNVESILAAAGIGAVIYGLPLAFASKFNFAIIGFSALVSALYVVKIGKQNLREVGGLKVFLITIVYFIVICILPFQSLPWLYSMDASLGFILFFIFQYLYIFGITILFDLPDLENDPARLKTIAQMVGVRQTIFLSLVLMTPLLAYFVVTSAPQIYSWAFIVIHIPFYYFMNRKWKNYFYLAFFGEGMLGLLGLFYCFI